MMARKWFRFPIIQWFLMRQGDPGSGRLPPLPTAKNGKRGVLLCTGLLLAVLTSLLLLTGCHEDQSNVNDILYNIEVLLGFVDSDHPQQSTMVDIVGPGSVTANRTKGPETCTAHCEYVHTTESNDNGEVEGLIADGNGFVSWTCFHNRTSTPNPYVTNDTTLDFPSLGFGSDAINTTTVKCVALYDANAHALTLEVQGGPDVYSDVAMNPGQPQVAVCEIGGEPASSDNTDRCMCHPGDVCRLNPVISGTQVRFEVTNPAFRGRVVGGDPDCFDGFVTMDADKTCTVSVDYPTLGVEVTGHGRAYSLPPGSIDCREGNIGTCSGDFPFQSNATLVAEPNIGGRVESWGGDCSGTVETATVLMGDDRHCTVTFQGGIVFGQPGVVELLSLDPAGGDLTWIQGGSQAPTGTLALSADGRTAVFLGAVPGAATRTYFARDVVDDTTVAVANDGGSGGAVNQVSVSADGRFVAFDSDDPSLPGNSIPPATIGRRVFVKDLQTGVVQLVSTGDLSDYFSDPDLQVGIRDEVGADPVISANGRYVAFEGRLVRTPPSPALPTLEDSFRVLVRDTCAGISVCTPSTRIVSVTGDRRLPGPFSRHATRPTISADGRYVAFLSNSTFLSTDGVTDGTGPNLVFLHDRDADGDGIFDEAPLSPSSANQLSTQVISLTQTPSGQPLSSVPERPVMSANARYIVYRNGDTGLFDELGSPILMYDTCIGAAGPCTPSTNPIIFFGNAANSDRQDIQQDISGDGRFVSVNGFTPNFVFGILVQDTCLGSAPSGCTPGETRFVSVDSNGNPANGQEGRISGDGRAIAFESSQSNLLQTGTGALPDAFLAQTGFTPTTDLIPSIQRVPGAPFVVGSPEMLVTIEGEGFVPGSTVLWNGERRRTIYLGKSRLQVWAREDDFQSRNAFSIEVINPNGRISNTVWPGFQL